MSFPDDNDVKLNAAAAADAALWWCAQGPDGLRLYFRARLAEARDTARWILRRSHLDGCALDRVDYLPPLNRVDVSAGVPYYAELVLTTM